MVAVTQIKCQCPRRAGFLLHVASHAGQPGSLSASRQPPKFSHWHGEVTESSCNQLEVASCHDAARAAAAAVTYQWRRP